MGFDNLETDFRMSNSSRFYLLLFVFLQVLILFFAFARKLNISLVFITQSHFAVLKKQTKFYTAFYYENSNYNYSFKLQMKASKNHN